MTIPRSRAQVKLIINNDDVIILISSQQSVAVGGCYVGNQ